jgi:hypothetical protein
MSNQGWGKTEVNIGQVLNVQPPPGGTAEWVNLFNGNGNLAGRYGSDQHAAYWDPNVNPPPPPHPNSTTLIAFSPQPHVYAQVDLDATDSSLWPNNVGGGPTTKLVLPNAAGTGNPSCRPW